MWTYEFEAPKGERVLKRFWGVTNFESYWFDREANTWVTEGGNSNWDHRPRSFKAFKRYLRKHPELRALNEVVLGSRYVGHNVKARWMPLPPPPNNATVAGSGEE